MKRNLWIFLTILMATTLWAKGTGDGTSKTNAIEFDWVQGVTIPEANVDRWYRIDLSSISEFDQPNLILRLTNSSSTQDMHVKINLYYESSEESREYTIQPSATKIWSAPAVLLKTMGIREVYLKINADQAADINARMDETEDIQDACLNAAAFTGAATVSTGAAHWYTLDLSSVGATQVYVLTYQNTGTAEAVVSRQFSPTCPVSSPATRTMTIPAGQSIRDTLNRAMLSLLGKTPYLGVETSRTINMNSEVVTATAGNAFDACGASTPTQEIWYDIVAGESVTNYYRIALQDLLVRRYQPQISLSNDSNATEATVKVEFVINGQCNSTEYTTHTLTISAGETGTLDIARDMVVAIDSTVDYIYARISTTQPNMQAMWRMKHLHEGDRCKYATAINRGEKAYQDANVDVWYEIDISDAKAHTRDLVATIINRSASDAEVHEWIAYECPNHDEQDMHYTLSAGDTLVKTFSYSSFSSIVSDRIWFGLQANQAVSFMIDTVAAEPLEEEESRACEKAIPFDWTYGHVQKANDTVWYQVSMDTLRKAVEKDMLPYMAISNRGTTDGIFYVAYTYECPAQTAYSESEITISGLSTYEEFISTDMIKKTDKNIKTVYVRVTGPQELSYQLKMQQQEEGAACTNAIPFNWVTGNDHMANDTLWYLLDLREAKKSSYDLEIELTNRSAAAGTAHGELATVCPCLTTEKKTFSMRAGGSKKDTIPHATFESFGDTLWVQMAADVNLHFEAHLIEPAPFDTIYACDTAILVNFGTNYPVADTAWFYVLTDTVNHTPLVPQVLLTNGATAQTIKAEIAYHCPVTATMMTQTTSLAAGQVEGKLMERTTIESMASQHDTIWIRISGSEHGSFTFRVDLTDPNDGHDCAHAMYLEPDTALLMHAESELWYYLDREALVNSHKYLEVSYKNEDAATGYASVLVYGDCGSTRSPLLYLNHDELMALTQLTDTLTPALLNSLDGKYIYLNIQTEHTDSIHLRAVEQESIDTLWACDKAAYIIPNTDYTVHAGDTAWYRLNVRNLRENYIGDATMTITNLSKEESMSLQVAKSWECPIVYELISTQLSVEDEIQEQLSANDLSKMDSDIVYVRLIPNRDMRLRLDMQLAMGGDCADGIYFDWDNGNVHPGETALWYRVELDTTRIGKHDLRLHIDNLSTDTVTTTCAIYTDCLDKAPMVNVSYTFAPDSGKHKDIDRDLIIYTGMSQGQWYIYYQSSNTTRIWVQLISEAVDSTITVLVEDTVCNRSDYIDPFTGLKHVIDSEDEATLMWKDTIEFQDGTYLVDSIISFSITPIVEPQILTMAQLDSLHALPICKQGMEIYTKSATAILTRYYEEQAKASKYPIAAIRRLYWTATPDWEDEYTEIHTDYPGELPKTLFSLPNVAYIIELDNCAGPYPLRSEDTTLVVELWRTDSIIYKDTVCARAEYDIPGSPQIITEDGRLEAIAYNTTVTDTLGLPRLADSIYIYYLTVWKMPIVKEINTLDNKSLPTATLGEKINYTRCANDILSYYSSNYPYRDTLGIAEILWQKSINGSEYMPLDKDHNEPLLCGQDTIRLRYAAITAEEMCGDTIWSRPYLLIARPLPIHVPAFSEDSAYVVCGQPVGVEAVTAAIEDSIAADDQLAAHYQSITWEMQKGEEPWTELGTDALDARYDEIRLRLTIHTECGDTTYAFSRELEPASAENVAEYNTLPAQSMFGDRMLMINLTEIMEILGDTILAEEVHWYRVVGEQDYIEFDTDNKPYLMPAEGDTPDSLVQTGYYYTLPDAEMLSGIYYALVARQFNIDPEEGTCGYAMRTVVIKTAASESAPATRKVMERGNVIIITNDNQFDLNGRKL